MTVESRVHLFLAASIGIAWVSRSSLQSIRAHGFYRFFAWETIVLLFLMNMNFWFVDPSSIRQIISWLFLIVSLVLIVQGVRMLRREGKLDPQRSDPALVGIERTTELVTTGVYGYIRHPFYSSLLFLAWGILLKRVSWIGALFAVTATVLLLITAWREEIENVQYFGEKYQEYMKHTSRFIPFIF